MRYDMVLDKWLFSIEDMGQHGVCVSVDGFSITCETMDDAKEWISQTAEKMKRKGQGND